MKMKLTDNEILSQDPEYEEWLDSSKVSVSEYPMEYIPADGEAFVGIDYGSSDGDCTVKGFYKDGKMYIQEIEYYGQDPEVPEEV